MSSAARVSLWALKSPHTTGLGHSANSSLPPCPSSPNTACLGYSGPILSPKPFVTSYDMPGLQWTYSIPGPTQELAIYVNRPNYAGGFRIYLLGVCIYTYIYVFYLYV